MAVGLRIDVIAPSQTSHVLSLSGVAQELARRNHEVSFVSFDENKKHATNLSFASLGPVPKPASAYGNCQNIFGFLREINDYSVAVLPVLAARFSSSASRPDVIAIDCTYPVAIPFCDSIPCVCLIANDVGLPMLGSNSDLKPCMISGLSSSDLRASFVARLKDFVLTRVLRWNNNKVFFNHVVLLTLVCSSFF